MILSGYPTVSKTRYKRRYSGKYRSGLEQKVSEILTFMDVKYSYETESIIWVPNPCRYTPDFICDLPDGERVWVEVKGFFSSEDRAKIKLVQEQHPDRAILMAFGNPATKINKRSKTDYGTWCNSNGVVWCRWSDLSDGDLRRAVEVRNKRVEQAGRPKKTDVKIRKRSQGECKSGEGRKKTVRGTKPLQQASS